MQKAFINNRDGDRISEDPWPFERIPTAREYIWLDEEQFPVLRVHFWWDEGRQFTSIDIDY